MGYGFSVHCPQCGYENTFNLGIGRTYPAVYQGILEAIRKSEYGSEWQEFVTKEAGAVFDAQMQLYQCSDCHALSAERDLSLYRHKDGERLKWSYWTPDAFEGQYEFVKSRVHRCPKCSKRMHKVLKPRDQVLMCPECGQPLVRGSELLWD